MSWAILIHRWVEKLTINYLKRLNTLISRHGYPVHCPITLRGPIKICFHMSSTLQYFLPSVFCSVLGILFSHFFYGMRRQNWAKCKHGRKHRKKSIRLTIKFNGNTLKAGGAERLVNWPEFSPKKRVQRVQVQRFISVARTLDINCRSTYGQVPGGKISFYLYSCHTFRSSPCIFNLSLPYGRFACPICTADGKEVGLRLEKIL